MDLFERNMLAIYGEKGKKWLSDLPHLVQAVANEWHLTGLTPVNHLSYNYVLKGFCQEAPIVLKIGFDKKALAQEADALKAFKGDGAISLLKQRADALLLEQCLPGYSLKEKTCKKGKKPIEIACEVTQRLHRAPLPIEGNFPHIEDLLATLNKDWPQPQLLHTDLLQKARDLSRDLSRDLTRSWRQKEVKLLHGDLHQGNILACSNKNCDETGDETGIEWRAIDPKGVIGAPIHEIWAFIMDMEKDTQYVADFFQLDLQEVRQWYFVHLMLAATFHLEEGQNPQPNLFLDLAQKAASLF